MKQSLSFLKLKLTNNTLDQHGHVRHHLTYRVKIIIPCYVYFSVYSMHVLLFYPPDHPALHASLLPQVSYHSGRQSLHCPLGPISDLLLPRDDLHCSDSLPKPKGINLYSSSTKHRSTDIPVWLQQQFDNCPFLPLRSPNWRLTTTPSLRDSGREAPTPTAKGRNSIFNRD